MTLTCLVARPGLRLGYRCRPRSETTVRCAASPFGDAKNTASTSSPFGGAAASPFGSGAKSVAADPFASGTHDICSTHNHVQLISGESPLT